MREDTDESTDKRAKADRIGDACDGQRRELGVPFTMVTDEQGEELAFESIHSITVLC
jgi:hypothetical protein